MKRIIALVIFISVILFSSSLTAQQAPDKPNPGNVYSQILVCSKAFEALGKLGDTQAKDVLINGLKSNEYLIRSPAIEALGKLRCKEAIPLLKELIVDRNYLIRITSIFALAKLDVPGMEELLLTHLSDKDVAIRAITAEKLEYFGDKYSAKLFEVLSREDSYPVRETLIRVLGNNKFKPATEYITRALEDTHAEVRRAACEAIFNIKDKDAIPLLKNKLNDTDVFVRASVKEALGALKETSIIKSLWQEIEDEDPIIRSSSYVALANLKDINILPILLDAIVKPENERIVKQEAARALRILKPYVQELVSKSLLKTKSGILSLENLDVGYQVGNKNLILLLTESLRDTKNPLYDDAPSVLRILRERIGLPALRETLLQDNAELVGSVAFALGELQDKDAVNSLIQVCKKYGF